MCAYRTLYSFIDFELLKLSLKQMGHDPSSITANNDKEDGKEQQLDLDINDYKALFAEDYCANLRDDLESQVSFIERLE